MFTHRMHRHHNYDIYRKCFCHYRANIAGTTKLLSLDYVSLQKVLPAKSEILGVRWKMLDPCLRGSSQDHLGISTATSAGKYKVRKEREKSKERWRTVLIVSFELKHTMRYLCRNLVGNYFIHRSESLQRRKERLGSKRERGNAKSEEKDYLCKLRRRNSSTTKRKC